MVSLVVVKVKKVLMVLMVLMVRWLDLSDVFYHEEVMDRVQRGKVMTVVMVRNRCIILVLRVVNDTMIILMSCFSDMMSFFVLNLFFMRLLMHQFVRVILVNRRDRHLMEALRIIMEMVRVGVWVLKRWLDGMFVVMDRLNVMLVIESVVKLWVCFMTDRDICVLVMLIAMLMFDNWIKIHLRLLIVNILALLWLLTIQNFFMLVHGSFFLIYDSFMVLLGLMSNDLDLLMLHVVLRWVLLEGVVNGMLMVVNRLDIVLVIVVMVKDVSCIVILWLVGVIVVVTLTGNMHRFLPVTSGLVVKLMIAFIIVSLVLIGRLIDHILSFIVTEDDVVPIVVMPGHWDGMLVVVALLDLVMVNLVVRGVIVLISSEMLILLLMMSLHWLLMMRFRCNNFLVLDRLGLVMMLLLHLMVILMLNAVECRFVNYGLGVDLDIVR